MFLKSLVVAIHTHTLTKIMDHIYLSDNVSVFFSTDIKLLKFCEDKFSTVRV